MADYPAIIESAYEAAIRDLFVTMFKGISSGDKDAVDNYRAGLKIAEYARAQALEIGTDEGGILS